MNYLMNIKSNNKLNYTEQTYENEYNNRIIYENKYKFRADLRK